MQKLPLEQSVQQAAASAGFDLQGYKFKARQEQNRKPQIVKIGLIQNSIKAPTTAPYSEQTKVHIGGLLARSIAAFGQSICGHCGIALSICIFYVHTHFTCCVIGLHYLIAFRFAIKLLLEKHLCANQHFRHQAK